MTKSREFMDQAQDVNLLAKKRRVRIKILVHIAPCLSQDHMCFVVFMKHTAQVYYTAISEFIAVSIFWPIAFWDGVE